MSSQCMTQHGIDDNQCSIGHNIKGVHKKKKIIKGH